MNRTLPFNKPFQSGNELRYVAQAQATGRLAGDGPFTKRCHAWLEARCASPRALLTNSCTAGLELAALLLDIRPGDEVIMPSYTFVSTANAFVLRGAIPVFVDIRQDTLNLDEGRIEDAITPKTRAIVPVHYAGVACEMDAIMAIARRHGLQVVEDAAQGLLASYKGAPLGSIGDVGALSFHETKNVVSGEGGALLVNDPQMIARAEIIREKGTDRSRFLRGEIDKYTWQEVGSSFLPSELMAAFLLAQLEHAADITEARIQAWNYYHNALAPLEEKGLLRRPVVPAHCRHNAHIYYVLLDPSRDRQRLLTNLKASGVAAASHYVPLHSSPAGRRYGRVHGDMRVTDSLSTQIVRLPLWVGLSRVDQDYVVQQLEKALAGR
jgi:TDP-4-keto-6-deoxy-D-glucose transaminase